MLVSNRAAPARPPQADSFAPPLAANARVDVCIAGCGLAGLVAAYLLARDKHAVMVIEDGPLGGPYAVPEIAHLASRIEQPFHALEARIGEDGARIAAQSHAAAIDALEALVRREHIACDFERLDGYRFGGPGERVSDLEAEVLAARHAGMTGVELVNASIVEGTPASPCIRYPAQAQLHPVKLAAGLARAIAREGGRIHCGVRTRGVHSGRPSTLVTTAGHRIEAEVLVVPAAAPPVPNVMHAIGLRVPRGSVTHAIFWEHGIDGTLHARLRVGAAAGEVLIVGGSDDWNVLASWARARFPRSSDVLQRFSGEVPRPADLFAFHGEDATDSQSVYVSNASWGTPMTRAAIAGMVVRDFVEGARNSAGDAFPRSACYTPPL
jgi:glycine/D-amino acid oxidase-like deaminating enzyme